jgi:parvulin-like peptidyl-prolyl isomerase
MRWRERLAWGWLPLALTASGCLSKTSSLSALPPSPPPVAAQTESAKEVIRSQIPEGTDTAICHLISLPVDRPADATHARPSATIRAVVNNELILDEEVFVAAMADLASARSSEDRARVMNAALEKLIDREVLLQDAFSKLERGGKQGEAFLKKLKDMAREEIDKRWLLPTLKRQKISSQEELAEIMQKSGLSLGVMRRFLERQYMADQYILSRLDPYIKRIGHTEISEYYNTHRDEFTQPDSVEWQDIFIDARRHASPAAARQFAESLVERTRKGEDFAYLSKEFDNGESGPYRKGAGKGNKRGEIDPPQVESRLFEMKEGDIDIAELPHGLHVFRLVKRQHAGPIPFDAKVQNEISRKLRETVLRREREKILKETKRKAVIERSDKPW